MKDKLLYKTIGLLVGLVVSSTFALPANDAQAQWYGAVPMGPLHEWMVSYLILPTGDLLANMNQTNAESFRWQQAMVVGNFWGNTSPAEIAAYAVITADLQNNITVAHYVFTPNGSCYARASHQLNEDLAFLGEGPVLVGSFAPTAPLREYELTRYGTTASGVISHCVMLENGDVWFARSSLNTVDAPGAFSFGPYRVGRFDIVGGPVPTQKSTIGGVKSKYR